jgi:hypothetical protein
MSAEPLQPLPNLYGPYTDEDLHIAVTRAWCRLPSRRVRRAHPIRGYVFGWHFASSMARVPVDSAAVVQGVLRIVCQRVTGGGRLVPLPLPTKAPGLLTSVVVWWRAFVEALAQTSGRSSRPTLPPPLLGEQRGPFEVVAAWWRPLDGQDDLGLHWVELRDGLLVFLAVASRTDRPDPGDSQ